VSEPESKRSAVRRIRQKPEIAFWGEECLRKALLEKGGLTFGNQFAAGLLAPGLIELMKPAVYIIAKE
jgi:hypothetical protein